MGLIIGVSRSDVFKSQAVHAYITEFCDDVVVKDDEMLLIPRPGKLVALLERLNQHRIPYHFPQAEHDGAL